METGSTVLLAAAIFQVSYVGWRPDNLKDKDPNTHPTPYPLILCTHRNSHWSFTHETTPSPPWQVFFIIGLGYFLRRLSAFPEEYVQALNSFTMKLALPALLFVSGLQGLVGRLVKVY